MILAVVLDMPPERASSTRDRKNASALRHFSPHFAATIAAFAKQEAGSICGLFSGLKSTFQFSPNRNLTCKHSANNLIGKPKIGLRKPFYAKISMVQSSRTLPIRTEIVTFTRSRAGSPRKLPAFATMPTQMESVVTADERRCRRLLLAAAVWGCSGVEQPTICSSASLVL
jgi:hypothetical protein